MDGTGVTPAPMPAELPEADDEIDIEGDDDVPLLHHEVAQDPSDHAAGAVEDELDPAALEQYHDEQYHEEYEVEPADDAEAAAAAVAEEEAAGHEEIYEQVQAADAGPAPAPAELQQLEEWQRMQVPHEWLPSPTFWVNKVPPTMTAEELHLLLERPGVAIKSIAVDLTAVAGRCRALVRLQPPSAPGLAASEAAPSADPSAANGAEADAKPRGGPNARPQLPDELLPVAEAAVDVLKAAEPPIELAGERAAFEFRVPQVTLFVGAVQRVWPDEAAFHATMAQYGPLERCFLMHNPEGASKDYGFVEFSLPATAERAKSALDKMRHGAPPKRMTVAEKKEEERRQEEAAVDGAAAPSASLEDAVTGAAGSNASAKGPGLAAVIAAATKQMRAEWATPRSLQSQYGRTIFIHNLKTSPKDAKDLRAVCETYGQVLSVDVNRAQPHAPIRQRTFAFVTFAHSYEADAAYRQMDGLEHESLGKLAVSFCNPLKEDSRKDRTGKVDPRQVPPVRLGPTRGQATQGGRGRMGFTPGANFGRGRGGMAAGGAGRGARGAFPQRPMAMAGGFQGGAGGRGMMGRGGRGLAGRGFNAGRGMPGRGMAGRMQPPPPHMRMMQQGPPAPISMHIQLQQQQLAMQQQLAKAQAEAQAYQAQAARAQQEAVAAQFRLQQEAEARRRAEEEAHRAAEEAALAARIAQAKQALPMYAGGYDYSGGHGPASAGYAASGPPAAPYSAAPHAVASYGTAAAAPVAYSAPGGYGAANGHMTVPMVSRAAPQGSQTGYGAQSGYQTSSGYDTSGAYAAPDPGYGAGSHHAGVVTPQRQSAAHEQYSAQQYSPQGGYGAQQSYGAQPTYSQQPSSYAQQPALAAGYRAAAQYQQQQPAGYAGPADPGMRAAKRDYDAYAPQATNRGSQYPPYEQYDYAQQTTQQQPGGYKRPRY